MRYQSVSWYEKSLQVLFGKWPARVLVLRVGGKGTQLGVDALRLFPFCKKIGDEKLLDRAKKAIK